MKLWPMLTGLYSRFAPRAALRVVVDTNILISGTIAESGFPARIVDAAIAGRIRFVVSAILVELKPFRSLRREPLRGGTCPDSAPAGTHRPRRAPLVIFPLLRLVLAVAAVAPAWAR